MNLIASYLTVTSKRYAKLALPYATSPARRAQQALMKTWPLTRYGHLRVAVGFQMKI
jgi:hypothetical protein